MSIFSEIVDINVGGVLYTTTIPTLTKYEDSMLASMFGAFWKASSSMHNGHYFIDREGDMFKYVLNFLRSGHINLETDFDDFERLEIEADFYQIPAFTNALYNLKNKRNKKPTKSGYYLELLDCEETAYFYRFYSDPPKGINTELKNSGIVLSGPKNILLTLPLPDKSIKELLVSYFLCIFIFKMYIVYFIDIEGLKNN